MLIKESQLRAIIREELLKEHVENNLELMQEGFMSDIASNTGLVICTGIITLIANIGKALANPASQQNVDWFKDRNVSIQKLADKVQKDKHLPDGYKVVFKDSCDKLDKQFKEFEKANKNHQKIQDMSDKNLKDGKPNKGIDNLLDKMEEKSNKSLNDLIKTQEQCEKAVKDAKKKMEEERDLEIIRQANAQIDYLEGK